MNRWDPLIVDVTTADQTKHREQEKEGDEAQWGNRIVNAARDAGW